MKIEYAAAEQKTFTASSDKGMVILQTGIIPIIWFAPHSGEIEEKTEIIPPAEFTRAFNRTLERIKGQAFESEQRKKKFEFTIFGYTFKLSIYEYSK